MAGPRLLQPADVAVRPGWVTEPTVTLSIDVESDYNSRQYQALARLGDLLAVIADLGVPLTAFVEGQFFENRQHVPEQLVAAGVDVQLHCYDHLGPGDGPDDLRRGADAYRRFMGRRPEGYRAHTYRLTPELLRALVAEEFRWDSSVLPGIAQGGNRARSFSEGDYLVFDDRLIELPVATWPGIPLPLIHSYRLLLKPLGEALFRRFFGYPRLVVYDMHMVDLVWSGSLAGSPLPPLNKALYRYMWGTNRSDSFDSLRRLVHELRRRGYTFMSMSDLCRRISAGPEGSRA